ncbi:MAG TPA: DUF2975 domain-containing protein [bacterium]|nr:DUF2975 domain-containing protein [bacterium]
MKRNSVVFLQTVVILIGICTLAFMLWEPQIEGRNAHATLLAIYFQDPFLTYIYISSLPFFLALYQTIKILGHIGRNNIFTQENSKALQTVKYCALTIIGLAMVGEIFIKLGHSDDRAGGVAMGLFVIFFSVIVATLADVFAAILQSAIHKIKQ